MIRQWALLLLPLIAGCKGGIQRTLSTPPPVRGESRFEVRYNPCACQPDRPTQSDALELRQGVEWERVALDTTSPTGQALLQLMRATPTARYLISGRLGAETVLGERGHNFPLLEPAEDTQTERLTKLDVLPMLKPGFEEAGQPERAELDSTERRLRTEDSASSSSRDEDPQEEKSAERAAE
ncbi:MAG: hypothetical protein VYD19_08890 [Myxococcota bacterium]|nr:hypothetical protein [Myxococcota bacterium]